MSAGTGDNTIWRTPQDQLDAMQRHGIEPLVNGWMAGRMPPSASVGIHPLEFYAVYDNGGLFQQLIAELGPAMPSAALDFKMAARENAPDPNMGLDNLMKPTLT